MGQRDQVGMWRRKEGYRGRREGGGMSDRGGGRRREEEEGSK